MKFLRYLWEWEETKHFINLKSVIKAKTSDIKNFLDKNATKKGAKSWLFVPPGSDNKICLVAHIDVIFETPQPKKIIKRKHGEKREWTSPQGISGDDRCGVWALLHIYRNMAPNKRPILLFTDEEETGLFGAKEAVKVFKNELKEVTYFIEIDRKGKDDMVFYNYDAEEFRKHIGKEGFKDQPGMTSDIKVLGKTFKKSSVNVSAGYYGQHTKEEYIIIKELLSTIEKVKNICIKNEPLSPEAAKLPKEPKFEPYKGKYSKGESSYWNGWDEYFGDSYDWYDKKDNKPDEFKVGDRVKVVKYKGSDNMIGKEGVVIKVESAMTFYKNKVHIEDKVHTMADDEIEKIEKPKKEEKSTSQKDINVGESVKVIDWSYKALIGKIGLVKFKTIHDGKASYRVEIGNVTYIMFDNNIDPINNEPKGGKEEIPEILPRRDKAYWDKKREEWKQKRIESMSKLNKDKEDNLKDWEKKAKEYQKEIDKKKGIQ